MANVNIEIDDEMKDYIQALADQMGVSVADWCVFAISQQVMVHEAMNDMFSDIQELFEGPQQIDLESFKNLGNIIDVTEGFKKK